MGARPVDARRSEGVGLSSASACEPSGSPVPLLPRDRVMPTGGLDWRSRRRWAEKDCLGDFGRSSFSAVRRLSGSLLACCVALTRCLRSLSTCVSVSSTISSPISSSITSSMVIIPTTSPTAAFFSKSVSSSGSSSSPSLPTAAADSMVTATVPAGPCAPPLCTFTSVCPPAAPPSSSAGGLRRNTMCDRPVWNSRSRSYMGVPADRNGTWRMRMQSTRTRSSGSSSTSSFTSTTPSRWDRSPAWCTGTRLWPMRRMRASVSPSSTESELSMNTVSRDVIATRADLDVRSRAPRMTLISSGVRKPPMPDWAPCTSTRAFS
mmetsp:Transcript_1813/g.5273  ORF Transcript_1813/g.5273 Transcript_1813/m.5273 type:complete len:320 (+) Transcript_1813:552-1511(+)